MPLMTLSEIEALPRFSIAIEDIARRVPDDLRSTIPHFLPGAYERPFSDGWEPLICFARLWWWN